MSNIRKLAENVHTFIFEASQDYGKIQAERFSQDIFCQLVEGKFQSPIEDLFFIACHLQCTAEFLNVNPEPDGTNEGVLVKGRGVFIQPQVQIGKYRVDFLISQYGVGPDDIFTPVIVELDGHDFHDKDKKQRAYEKSRDRYFVKSGYKVLHFTGAEIFVDPYRVAFEALALLGVYMGSRDEFDPKNPLGFN